MTHIRKDKGLEGCIDTTQLAAVQARPRTAAAPGGRRNSNQGGHPGAGSRRGGGEGKGRGRKVGGGRQVSELFTVGGEAVTVKENVFRAASDSQKPLEMCVVGTGFSGVRRGGGGGKGWPWYVLYPFVEVFGVACGRLRQDVLYEQKAPLFSASDEHSEVCEAVICVERLSA